MRESTYQRDLIRKIQQMFPGCFVLKNDPALNQGIPDLLILFRNTWAMLEVKMADNSPEQPNQDYYVRVFDEMSYASFINPENEELVLSDLQYTFGLTG